MVLTNENYCFQMLLYLKSINEQFLNFNMTPNRKPTKQNSKLQCLDLVSESTIQAGYLKFIINLSNMRACEA